MAALAVPAGAAGIQARGRARGAALVGLALALGLGSGSWVLGVPMEDVASAGDATPDPASPKALRSLGARGAYVVIDRTNNRLWLRNAEGVVFEAPVSTGSNTVLVESGGEGRTWTFETPRGRFPILRERARPVWVKPDWAFLEEGRAVPTSFAERVEKGALGEWALDLGDGYMIHGTLYERLIGRPVTHGCVRVGRDDLRRLVAAVGPGTPVYIF